MAQRSLFTSYPLEDYLAHREEVEKAVQRVLERGQYVLGPEVGAFEKEFAAWTGVRHAIGVGSGTDAIELLLRGLGIGAGDGVAVASHTAVACAAAIGRAGARPVFVDVDAVTYTISPESLELALRGDGGIKAVLAVHLYGHPASMAWLRSVCEAHGVVLLEDGAQAHGAESQGRRVGSLARGAAFSFYPTKNLGAMGDAGAITTDDDALAMRVRELRQYGWRERFVSAMEGVNSRLDEMQAAILRVKLRTLEENLEKRRQLAGLYADELQDATHVTLPVVQPGFRHAHHLYVIRTRVRDAMMKRLLDLGVPVAVHYPEAVHRQPAYAGLKHGPLPQTEALMPEILSLPLHPYLAEEAVRFAADAVRRCTGP